MEQFWIEAKRVLAQFRKAKYIYFDEPEEIVIGCIAENYYNKRAKKSAPGVVDIFGSEESHVYQEKYTQWMEEDRKSTRLNSSHPPESRMPSSA